MGPHSTYVSNLLGLAFCTQHISLGSVRIYSRGSVSKDSRVSEILESGSKGIGAVGDPSWTIGGSEVLRHGEIPYSRVPTSSILPKPEAEEEA